MPYWPGVGQVDARAFLHDLLEEGVRHLDQHAGAVAGVDLAAAGAAMIEVHEHLDALLEDAMRLAALDVDDEADAAGVVLERGSYRPCFGGRPVQRGRSPSALLLSFPSPLYSIRSILAPPAQPPRARPAALSG